METAVPVLMYHHVNPHRGDPFTITPEAFEAQMRYLAQGSFRTLSIAELLAFAEGRKEIGQRSLVLTFDDGYLDFWLYAYPVLKRYGLKAAIFLVTSWVKDGTKPRVLPYRVPSHGETKALIRAGRSGEAILSWEEVREMVETGVVEVHSHTHTHPRCPLGNGGIDPERLKGELALSMAVLEEELQRPCQALCWPWGLYDDGSVRIAREIGYRALFTTERGIVTKGSGPWALKRIVVKKGDVGWLKSRLWMYGRRWSAVWYLKLRGL